MADYKCSKCGQEVFSKCVFSRNIFGGNQTAALLTHVLKRTVEKVDKNHNKYVFTYTYRAETELNALQDLRHFLNQPGVVESYACDHEYILQDEECDLGCCHRKKEAG